MKRVIILMLTLALFVTGCSSGGSSDGGGSTKPIDLKMSVTTSESSVWMVAANEFKRIVEDETEGRYTVSLFPNEQLSSGDMQKGIEMLLNGTTDLDIHSTIIWTGYEPKLSVVSMPWLFPRGYDSVDEIIFNGAGGDMIKELVRSTGAEPLGLGENGFRQITNNSHPIESVEDMKGLKIRTPAMAMYIDLYQLLGADPTSMSFAEVFTALQQGTIDGQENPWDTIRSSKIQEVQDYLTVWDYSYDPIIITASAKVWDSLSDEDKEIFHRAGEEAGKIQVEESRKMDINIKEQFIEEGMEITELNEEQIAEFTEAARPIYEDYREQLTDEVLEAFGYSFD